MADGCHLGVLVVAALVFAMHLDIGRNAESGWRLQILLTIRGQAVRRRALLPSRSPVSQCRVGSPIRLFFGSAAHRVKGGLLFGGVRSP